MRLGFDYGQMNFFIIVEFLLKVFAICEEIEKAELALVGLAKQL
jgi:hypothetical protein